MIRIAHLVTDLSFSGGDHIYIESLLSYLAEHHGGEVELHVVELRSHGSGNSSGVYERLAAKGVRFHLSSEPFFADMTMRGPALLSRVLTTQSLDIVHTHTLYSELCALICRIGSRPYELELVPKIDPVVASRIVQLISTAWTELYHDVLPLETNEAGERIPSHQFGWISTKHISTLISLANQRDLQKHFGGEPDCLGAATHLNALLQKTVSEAADRIVSINSRAQALWGTVGLRSELIPVSIVDVEAIPSAADRPRMHEDGLMFVYAARLTGKKNPDLLVSAFVQHLRDRPNDRLVFYGDGPLLECCRQLAEGAVGISFAGHLDREDLLSRLSAADAFCLFSSEEGLPLAVQEAMAIGLPILATDVGGMGDLVTEDVNGLFAGDATIEQMTVCLARFAALPEARRNEMRRRSRARIEEQMRPRVSYERYLQVYQSLQAGLSPATASSSL